MNTSCDDCHRIDLPQISDSRGNLSVIESGRHVPFEIKRVFYLYDVPDGQPRGGHALMRCHQFIVALSGSFDLVLDDAVTRRCIHLCRSDYGVHVPPLIWRDMSNFSSTAVCFVLASEPYSEQDYYRNYQEFIKVKHKHLPLTSVI